MVEDLTRLKLGVLLLWHKSTLDLTSLERTILSIEAPILASIEGSISFFEQIQLIAVVEQLLIRRKLRTNQDIRGVTTTGPSSVVFNRLTVFPKCVGSLKYESTALKALLTNL